MSITTNQSEVARLLHSIEQAYEAAHRGLDGPAIVGPHRRRTDYTEEIARSFEQLQPLVGGPNQAMQLLDTHLNTITRSSDV